MLVTNAELAVLDYEVSKIGLDTGRVPVSPCSTSVDWVVLKHPFPTPEGMAKDLRDEGGSIPEARVWSQHHKESIYIVKAPALAGFMEVGRRDHLRLVL